MRKPSLTHAGNLFFGLFLLMFLAIGSTYFSRNIMVLRAVLLLAVPLHLTFYFYKKKRLSVAVISFLLFVFLGNAFTAIFYEANYTGISNILYLVASVSLMMVLGQNYKAQLQIKNKLIIGYLLVMFTIGLCFLLEISHIFSALVTNEMEFYVFVFQGLSLLVLGLLSFGLFLSNARYSAIYFFVAIVCFGFALAVNYVSIFYLYDFVFELLSALFYVSGLYFLFKFLLKENHVKPQKSIKDHNVSYSEIVFT
ncbi:hypothetical protein ABI125_07465 [Tamlana crocina]